MRVSFGPGRQRLVGLCVIVVFIGLSSGAPAYATSADDQTVLDLLAEFRSMEKLNDTLDTIRTTGKGDVYATASSLHGHALKADALLVNAAGPKELLTDRDWLRLRAARLEGCSRQLMGSPNDSELLARMVSVMDRQLRLTMAVLEPLEPQTESPSGGTQATRTFSDGGLHPGSGFDGPTAPPAAVGSGFGASARAIARWDVVPDQVFSSDFRIGVVAYHVNGIDRVEFSVEGGDWYGVSAPSKNDRTGVVEYVATLAAADFADGKIEVRAIAYPVAGVPRVLDSLTLWANPKGTLTSREIFVDGILGNDLNPGTKALPVRTIGAGLVLVSSGANTGGGGFVTLIAPGTYDVPNYTSNFATVAGILGCVDIHNSRWITVRPADGLARKDVTIAPTTRRNVRMRVDRLAFSGVTIDFDKVRQFYLDGPQARIWFDGCRWTNPFGRTKGYTDLRRPVANPSSSCMAYATSSEATDVHFGFVDHCLVRGCRLSLVSLSAFSETDLVLDSTVDDLDGTIFRGTSSLLAWSGTQRNVIVSNLIARDIDSAANVQFGATSSSYEDFALVNVAVENVPRGTGVSTLAAPLRHAFFAHLSNPGQKVRLRDDLTGTARLAASVVVFENCVLEDLAPVSGSSSLPSGITVDHTHFCGNRTFGKSPTSGSVSVGGDATYGFEYAGSSAIDESASLIPDLTAATWTHGSAAKPNRGAFPFTVTAPKSSGETLVPGTGFTGETAEPSPVGSGSGSDARAIARFDVVPGRTFDGEFRIGVVAFHINGIDRIEFSAEGGKWASVTEPTTNSRTGVREYTATIDAKDYNDGAVEVRAIAYPVAGKPRVLEPLFLYANANGSVSGPEYFVDPANGSDSNAGTRSAPLKTIARAFLCVRDNSRAIGGAGTITLLREATYDLPNYGSDWATIDGSPRPIAVDNDAWLEVRADSGLSRDKVILAPSSRQLFRPHVKRLKLEGVTLDFGKIEQVYTDGDGSRVWFDGCRWTDSNGWAATYMRTRSPVRASKYHSGSYVTGCLVRDQLYGFTDQALVRDSRLEKISGDALQNSRLVLNVTVDTMDGTVLSHHSDLLQYFGHHENVIVFGVKAMNVKSVQNFFLDHYESSFTDCAFVNVAVDNHQQSTPFTQFNAANEHVLFLHVSNPGQAMLFRDDFSGDKQYTAKNVAFVNCVIERLSRGSRQDGLPSGVSVSNCQFVNGSALGTLATSGSVTLTDGTDALFGYSGTGVSGLSSSGKLIPDLLVPDWKYGSGTKPNRGAFPFRMK